MKYLYFFAFVMIQCLGALAAIDWENFSSNLPIVLVDSHGQEITKDGGRVLSSIKFIANDEGLTNYINDNATGVGSFVGLAGIKLRGQSSLSYPKKSYSIETWDEEGEDFDTTILGFPEHVDYALHGPYHDRTMLRNYFSYNVERELVGRWSPRTQFCELFVKKDVNETREEQFKGLYIFMELIKRGDERIDIKKKKDDNPDRGYIFKNDKVDPGDPTFSTGCASVIVEYPSDPNQLQLDFLKSYLEEYCHNLVTMRPNQDWGYPHYIDVLSWQDQWLLRQLAHDTDGFGSSSYFWKDAEKKAFAGSLWDLDNGYGSGQMSDFGITGWKDGVLRYWQELVEDPAFVKGLVARWQQLRSNQLTTSNMLQIIDDVVPSIRTQALREVSNWDDQVTHLKNWITSRATWMDQNIEALVPSCTPDCASSQCGWDGCGGSCGNCTGNDICVGHSCIECNDEECEVPPLTIYDDKLVNGFLLTKFGTVDLENHEYPRPDSQKEAKLTCRNSEGFKFYKSQDIPQGLIGVSLWVNGGLGNGQPLVLEVNGERFNLSDHIKANTWNRVQFEFTGSASAIEFRCRTSLTLNPVYMDQIEFIGFINNCENKNCDDNNACTNDTCDPSTGICSHVPTVQCDDSQDDACQTNTCNPSTGICELVDTTCDDEDLCTTDICHPVNGCQYAESVFCDGTSDDSCHFTACNRQTGTCEQTDVNCDDGDLCTVNSCDDLLGCTSTPVQCQNTQCETYTCNSAQGCVVQSTTNCDDGDSCTTDSCDDSLGCVNTPISGCSGNPGVPCTQTYQCSSVTMDYNFVECSGGVCACKATFDGAATPSDKCRCDKAGTKWSNGLPLCLSNGQCVADYNGFGCTSGACHDYDSNGIGSCL